MNQKTIKNRISIEGIGLHSGEHIKLTLSPAEENTGIIFFYNYRNKHKIFKLTPNNIIDTMLATKLGEETETISTIEHLLAALHANYITNIQITVNGPEIPILDGSSLNFIKLIDAAEVVNQNSFSKIINLNNNIEYKDDNCYIIGEPFDGFEVTYTLNSDQSIIGNKSFILNNIDDFKYIYKARTFANKKDILYLQSLGLIKGGSLENAVVVDNDIILNESLRYEDEFVKHKLIDFIGDIYCLGVPIKGKFKVFNSGHKTNNIFTREIYKQYILT